MSVLRPVAVISALLVVLPALASSSQGAATPRLTATVGPGSGISVSRNGTRVSKVPAGTYTLVVNDRSAHHNFHLTGSGVNVATKVAFTGTKSFTVTLKRSRSYHFQCDPHADDMFGDLRAT